MEANYAHQQELDMIPLMMQKDYKPLGWRKHYRGSDRCLCQKTAVAAVMCGVSVARAVGLLLGTRMW